jgi:hypothetical protein
MESMEKRQFFLVITILLICSTAFATTTDTLWQRAVQAFAKNSNWVPGKIVSHFEMKNGKGEAEEITDSIKKTVPAADGSIDTELVKLVFNGEDKTDVAKTRKNDDEFSLKEAPLHPENQSAITVVRTSDTKMINGVPCTGFEYTLQLDKRKRVGTIWINASGYPVQDDFSTTPLPPNVQKMNTRVLYSHKADGAFYLSQVNYSGEGGMLFIKKSFQGEMKYSEHWRETRN